MKINRKYRAKAISYAPYERKLSNVKAIVIHSTGNKGDTAENNAKYFATSNMREAGAHYFIDKQGKIYGSIHIKKIAYAVGGAKYNTLGGAKYYGYYTNANTVSIELCDSTKEEPYNDKQVKALKYLVKFIKKRCANCNHIIRHYDVNGKPCPMYLQNNTEFNKLKRLIE